jgi:nicotinate-nucleotide--dimethylbenzimidazole phosphoribosyltransferase
VTALDELAVAVERPDDAARREARELLGPEGTAGRLVDLAVWLAGVQGRVPAAPPSRARLLVLSDAAPARTVAVAAGTGIEVRLAGRRGEPGRRVQTEDACSREEALAAVLAGAALADEEVDAGTDLLVVALPHPDLGVAVATLVGLLTRSDASAVTATGQDDNAWMIACAATRDAMRRGRPVLADQVDLLATVGGADLAVATGLLLQAAARRTPVVLDGPAVSAAALVAARLSFRAPDWWLAGHLSPDPAHALALARVSLEPVLDLGLRGDDGTGALLAVPVLRAAVSG